MTEEQRSFKEELENLERIVRAMEREDLDLDDALKMFSEGVQRLKSARQLLKDAETTIKKVIEVEEDGEARTEDLEL